MPNETNSTYKRLHSSSGRVQLCGPASCCTFREGSRLGRSLCNTTVKEKFTKILNYVKTKKVRQKSHIVNCLQAGTLRIKIQGIKLKQNVV